MAGCVFPSAQAAREPKVEMTVQLPPFIVEQTAGPTWRYGQIPRFEILSRCNDASTERLALAFHRANQLLGLILPGRFQVVMDVPQTLVFYDEKLWPVAEQHAVAAMLRATPPARSAGPLEAQAATRGKLEPLVGADFLGLNSPPPGDQGGFFSNLMLTDADSITTFVLVSSVTIDPQETYLTPAYVENLLFSRSPGLPGWFTAGFLRFYNRVEIRNNTVSLKTARWEPKPATAAKAAGPEIELLPWLAFFDEPAPKPDMDPNLWLAQAELLITWGLDREGGRVESFWKFVERACTEPITESMFRDCLGLTFDEAARQLGAYALSPHKIRWVLPDDLAEPPPYSLEDASIRQIARIKGEWERLETRYVKKNQPELEAEYLALARRTLHKAYDRDDRDPRLLATLGLLEMDAGNRTVAREFLEESARRKVVRPRVYFELARLRYDYSMGRSPRDDGKLTAEQTNSILEPLLVATHQAPPLPQVYELMAHVCFNSAEPPSGEILAALDESTKYFPKNGDLLYKVAALYSHSGATDQALKLVQFGLLHISKESVREQLRELNKKLDEAAHAKR